jgi:hypothetical protein
LRSAACASEGAVHAVEVLDTKELEAYRKGLRVALVSVGLAFGLEPVKPQVKQGQKPPLEGLLWAETPTD